MDRIFGAVIRGLRERAGVTQSQAAKCSGLAQSAWSQLEDGSEWPQKRTILKICKGLNVSVGKFFLSVAEHIQALPSEVWEGWDDDECGE